MKDIVDRNVVQGEVIPTDMKCCMALLNRDKYFSYKTAHEKELKVMDRAQRTKNG